MPKYCGSKNCQRKGQLLDDSEFHTRFYKNKGFQLYCYCKQCEHLKARLYWQTNQATIRERNSRDRNPLIKVPTGLRRYQLSNGNCGWHIIYTSLNPTSDISWQDYCEMCEKQRNKCAICGRTNRPNKNGKICALAIDHSHITGHIRGLLCKACNTGIGFLQADISTQILQNAVLYLESWC